MNYVPLWLEIPIMAMISVYVILIVKIIYQITKEILKK